MNWCWLPLLWRYGTWHINEHGKCQSQERPMGRVFPCIMRLAARMLAYLQCKCKDAVCKVGGQIQMSPMFSQDRCTTAVLATLLKQRINHK